MPTPDLKYGERACAMCAKIYSQFEYGEHPRETYFRRNDVAGSRWGLCVKCASGDVDWEAQNG